MVNSIAFKLVLAFAAVLIGTVMLGVISTQTLAATSTLSKTDTTSFSLASARIAPNNINESSTASYYTIPEQITAGGWKTTDCPLTGFKFGNSTTTFELNTDYTINLATGVLHVNNSTTTVASLGNATSIAYTYCPDSYLNSSFGRTGVNIIPGFFALAIMLIGVGLFYSVGKEVGIV